MKHTYWLDADAVAVLRATVLSLCERSGTTVMRELNAGADAIALPPFGAAHRAYAFLRSGLPPEETE